MRLRDPSLWSRPKQPLDQQQDRPLDQPQDRPLDQTLDRPLYSRPLSVHY